MVANPKSFFVSAVEYLTTERKSQEKSEYIAGVITMMAGASREHNLIVLNMAAELRNRLRTRPCEVYPSDMRVHDPITKSFLYPDVVVICNEPRFLDQFVDTLLNPTVIIEVLSSTTEQYDRGKKAWAYRQIASLQEYILISQEFPYVERFTRQADGAWLLNDFQGLEAVLEILSIGCVVPLSEIYLKVKFSETE
jgi:Uma2 family endonuclease